MRLFGGKGLETFCEQVYYDFASPPASWLPLTMQARRHYEKEAILYTPIVDMSGTTPPLPGSAFDGHVPDCVWHRLLLDACIPPETSIGIKSRAANSQLELTRAAWQDEPALSLRRDGSELPYMPPSTSKDRGTWELLFQNARGRYLQLRLYLQGNERSTPRISALRAYYPRFSYLEHYLPATYREDRQSASFLDRYLANLEGFYTSIEDRIAAIQVLCDAYSAPPEVLNWLAGWFGVLLAPGWDEQRKRLFIRHAMDFFQYRGTIRGLQMALRLVLDSCTDERIFTDVPSSTSHIRIIEKYKTRTTPGILFGDTTDVSGVRLVLPTNRWTPSQGSAWLNALYTHDTQPGHIGTTQFPIANPGGSTSAAWQQFSQQQLGFVPAITTADPMLWRNFLARRYQTIKTYNAAYLTNLASFDDIPLPTQLPLDGKPLVDWYQFESIVLSMHNTAHRFVVLLPVPASETANVEKYQQRYDLAKRIITQEKPVQTEFDLRCYWEAFRVAEARLGEDTVLDRSSRVPPLILGQNYIGASTLTANYPQNVTDRQIVGRDVLSR
jgi:phage tail-like protein